MSTTSNVKALFQRQEKFCRKVSTAAEEGAAAWNLFNVSGGDILVLGFYGKVTGATIAGAATPRIQHTPTGGALTPLTAAADSIDTDVVNTIYLTDGAVATKFNPSAVIGVGVAAWGVTANNQILVPGVISCTNGGAVITAGIIEFTIIYIPLNDNAQVTAA